MKSLLLTIFVLALVVFFAPLAIAAILWVGGLLVAAAAWVWAVIFVV